MNIMKSLIAVFILFALLLQGCSAMPKKDLLAQRDEAYFLYDEGSYSQAIAKLEELVNAVPKDAELHFKLGNAYTKAALYEKAVEQYTEALVREPKLGKAWYNLSKVRLRQAASTLVEMQRFADRDDPAFALGKELAEGLLELIGSNDAVTPKTQ